jgi:hypothetical protein
VVRNAGKPCLVTPVKLVEIESMASLRRQPVRRAALKIAAELSDKARWPLTVLIVTDLPGSRRFECEGGAALDDYIIDKGRRHSRVEGGEGDLKFLDEGAVG